MNYQEQSHNWPTSVNGSLIFLHRAPIEAKQRTQIVFVESWVGSAAPFGGTSKPFLINLSIVRLLLVSRVVKERLCFVGRNTRNLGDRSVFAG